ncbi:alpha/beta fold hydrolase [Massilia sp. IC2-477]|uniref:alpha/beta fold hydrolase n=1 Tax=Massilia sp. IC2-477 TaxID=2887198 RepID=UPI001D11D32D|nr:alpha/beta hydrolase [Massilia sp. IC2-477]MCC2954665.1 alpha/beta fold hydrolase [Massilia sp. IC2-477]
MFKPALTLSALCLSAAAIAAPPAPVIDTIGGRQVESLTIRHPTSKDVVVFEGGSRNTIEKWGRVPEQLAHEATVFAYNRPGYGNSGEATTPRDGRTIVEELRAVLRHKGLKPPYVLVGHSLGGLYMQLFARAYPSEVKGLVLVDALYPGMVKKTDDFPFMTRLAGRLAFSGTVWREIEKIDDTGEMVLALGGIDDKPIVRLVNQPVSSTAIAVDFGAFRMDEQTRRQVRALYPKARKVVVDSSHQMALTSPEVVTAAVRQVLAATESLTTAAR